MSLYSSIDRRINADAWFRDLNEGPQLLWFRLLTGQHVTTVPGLWAATEDGLARAFRLPLERFRERFAELSLEPSSKGLPRVIADWDAGVIWLPNALEFPCNEPKNPNALASWKNHLDLMPECALKDQALRHFEQWVLARKKRFPKGWPYGSVNRSRNRSPNGSGNPAPVVPSQEQEQEQKQEREGARPAGTPGDAAPKPQPPAAYRAFERSFGQPSEVVRHVFASFQRVFDQPGSDLDSKRWATLSEREAAGMTAQDGDDVLAGAAQADHVTGENGQKRRVGIGYIFGDADRYAELLAAGRALRERPSGTLRKGATIAERIAADEAATAKRRSELGLPALTGEAVVPTREEFEAMLAGVGGSLG